MGKRKKVNEDADEEGTKTDAGETGKQPATKKVKLTSKAAAKNKRLVSDNFVNLNLKKKAYVRGAGPKNKVPCLLL